MYLTCHNLCVPGRILRVTDGDGATHEIRMNPVKSLHNVDMEFALVS